MSVKVCGRKIRSRKPIKVYDLVKIVTVLLVVSIMMIGPSFAAECANGARHHQASPEGSKPCMLQLVRMQAPAAPQGESERVQRSAGTPSMSPAMALALALGVRNVSGPVVRSERTAAAASTNRPSTTTPLGKQVSLLLKDGDCALAPFASPLYPQLAMER